jgi:hypothetical protein
MSVTNLQIINRALRELNVINETEDASPEQGRDCLAKLNGLMEIWKDVGIDFGWSYQASTSGNAPIPDYAELTVHTNLAILCASQYGATVSGELAAVADRLYSRILSKFTSESLDNLDMSHMPSGSGNEGSGYNINSDS